ncbi:MAG TPA: NTP transferase domain-containing protein [Vicinamibacterales bacterium]|nr:NTP transferase domain-containing protein [Vicinamibacterales bacterium]
MIQPDTVIVLQARMASQRLPGKAMERLAGDTLVGHCLRRLTSAGLAPVVLATTVALEDDVLAAEALRYGVRVIRGPREDVLRRFAQVARETGAAYLIRATADNPAVDIDGPARVLAAIRAGRADYCCERSLPHGAAVEAVRAEALLDAAAHAVEPYDREHVTPYVKFNRLRYRVLMPEAPAAVRRPDLRVTVDTPADLDYVHQVLEAAGRGTGPAPLADIIRAADALGDRARVA